MWLVHGSKADQQHRICHISLHCLNPKHLKKKKKNHSRAIWANLSNNSPCMRSETQLYLQILLFKLASDIHKAYLEGRMEVKPWGDLAVLSVSTFQVFCNVVKWPLTNTSTHSFDQFVASLIWPCSIFCCIIPVETWKKHGNESP